MAVVLTNGEYYISHDSRTGGIVKTSNVEEAQVFYSCNTAMKKVFKAPSKCKGYYPFELDNMDCGCKVKNGRKRYTMEQNHSGNQVWGVVRELLGKIV